MSDPTAPPKTQGEKSSPRDEGKPGTAVDDLADALYRVLQPKKEEIPQGSKTTGHDDLQVDVEHNEQQLLKAPRAVRPPHPTLQSMDRPAPKNGTNSPVKVHHNGSAQEVIAQAPRQCAPTAPHALTRLAQDGNIGHGQTPNAYLTSTFDITMTGNAHQHSSPSHGSQITRPVAGPTATSTDRAPPRLGSPLSMTTKDRSVGHNLEHATKEQYQGWKHNVQFPIPAAGGAIAPQESLAASATVALAAAVALGPNGPANVGVEMTGDEHPEAIWACGEDCRCGGPACPGTSTMRNMLGRRGW